MRKKYLNPSDEELMDDIRTGGDLRDAAWYYIDIHWGISAIRVTQKRAECYEQDAREAFSEACVGVDNRIRNTTGYGFLRSASLKTYLTTASIYAAYAILKKIPRHLEPGEREIGEDMRKHFDRIDCSQTMDKALNGITPRCKKILLMFNDGYSMDKIAQELGFANARVATNEVYECRLRFLRYLQENLSIRQQLKENCYD